MQRRDGLPCLLAAGLQLIGKSSVGLEVAKAPLKLTGLSIHSARAAQLKEEVLGVFSSGGAAGRAHPEPEIRLRAYACVVSFPNAHA